VAFAPATLFAGGITSFAGSVAAGALIGAAVGGLEQAIGCATGCGGVENLFLPVATGIVVGGILGALGGGVASKFLSKGTLGQKFLRFFIEPGKVGFLVKTTYASYSIAGGPGLGNQRTVGVDVVKSVPIGAVAATNASINGLGFGRPLETEQDYLIADFEAGGLGYLRFF